MTEMGSSRVAGLLARQFNLPGIAAGAAEGSILYSDGTDWVVLGPGTDGQALLTQGAGNPPVWGTDFVAETLTTTGNLILGATPATAGDFRVNHGFTMQGRDSGDAANRTLIDWGAATADTLRIGDGAFNIEYAATATHLFSIGAPGAGNDVVEFAEANTTVQLATTGDMRVGDVFSLVGRDAADTLDRSILDWSATVANEITLGDGTEPINIDAASSLGIEIAGTPAAAFFSTSFTLQAISTVTWARAIVAPTLTQVAESTALDADTLTIQAQNNSNVGAFDGGGLLVRAGNQTNAGSPAGADGGNLTLSSGSAAGGGSPGAIALQVGGTPHLTLTAAGELNLEIPSPALGGGAAATLGTIGGSGPTVAGQNQWLQIEIDGVTHFVAVWQ